MNNNLIHQTALISSKSKIGKNVLIGPYCIIEDDVIIKDHIEDPDSHIKLDQVREIMNHLEKYYKNNYNHFIKYS